MSTPFPFTLTDALQIHSTGLYEDSYVLHEDAAYWLVRAGAAKSLAILAHADHPALKNFAGVSEPYRQGFVLRLCPADSVNARRLRAYCPWLEPTLLGLGTSVGFGDRLGRATPGHAASLQALLRDHPDGALAPIFCQQSIREMTRTRRSPEDVMADATWGAFEAGWQGPVGADADHLKTSADIDATQAAGFTFFTIDPGAHVDPEAETLRPAAIMQKAAALPWDALETTLADLTARYAGKRFDLEDNHFEIDMVDVPRAAVKYGRAIAHVVALARHLDMRGKPYELEISVDETDSPTSWVEHYLIASELNRLGVRWVSLAPRLVGRFEKGVDYLGDLDELRRHIAGHAAIARRLGPYKLSLHSGSDKFSVYPMIALATGGLVHLKTAGTSYLEALRVVAAIEPALFREIGALARERYAEDRASYHVSAEVWRVPHFDKLPDSALPALLDDFHARQVFHVTYGSALDQFGTPIKAALSAHEAAHYDSLARHFRRHLEPLMTYA